MIMCAVLAFAPLLWALGSLLSPLLPQPPSSMMATALQMVSGGGMLLAAGTARGERLAEALRDLFDL